MVFAERRLVDAVAQPIERRILRLFSLELLNSNIVVKWLWLGIISVLAVATYVLLSQEEQFYVIDEQMLEDGSFLSGNAFWKNSRASAFGLSGNALTISHAKADTHRTTQAIPIQTSSYYRFGVGAGSDAVVEHREWSGGRVYVVMYDAQKNRVSSVNLAVLSGSVSPKEHTVTTYIGSHIHSIEFNIGLFSASGTFSVQSPVVQQLEVLPAYQRLIDILLGVWVCVLAVSGLLFYLLIGARRFAVTIVFAGLVVTPIFIPSDLGALVLESLSVRDLSFANLPDTSDFFGFLDARGVGHAMVFFLLAVIIFRLRPELGLSFCLLLIFWFALASEVMQMLVVGRTLEASDVFYNLAGVCVGVIFSILYSNKRGIFNRFKHLVLPNSFHL